MDNMIEPVCKDSCSERGPGVSGFWLVLHNNSDSLRRGSCWQWAEMDIRVLDHGGLDDSLDSCDESSEGEKPPRKGIVKFDLNIFPKRQARVALSTAEFDICLNVANMYLTPGIIGDERRGKVKVRIQRPHTEYNSWSSVISFQQLLKDPRFAHTRLTTEHRLALALKAASSLLHLYRTSWLKQSWTGDDIYLIQSSIGLGMTEVFVTQKTPDDIESPNSLEQFCSILEPSVFALGKFLTELSFNQPWAQVRRSLVKGIGKTENQMATMLADLAAVDAIKEFAYDDRVPPQDRCFYEEGPFYLEAVLTCLCCDLDGKASLEDRSFRQAVYAKIVRPLQFALDDYQYFNSGWNEFLDSSLSGSHSKDNEMAFALFDDKDARPEA